mmetsp:Transcript_9856/g.14808  ORF Transcript_9856/g.14808 Transcript_9856/m.14808 type:complete len:113 (-) Transcript_9856:481-819(-)
MTVISKTLLVSCLMAPVMGFAPSRVMQSTTQKNIQCLNLCPEQADELVAACHSHPEDSLEMRDSNEKLLDDTQHPSRHTVGSATSSYSSNKDPSNPWWSKTFATFVRGQARP